MALDAWMVQDFSGSGSRVVRILPLGGPALVYFESAGCQGNHTAVRALGSDGQMSWLPINVLGDCRTICLADGTDETVAFQVACEGSWVLGIRPVGDARPWTGGHVSGVGGDVLVIPGGIQAFCTVDFQIQTNDHAAVWAYSDYDKQLLFNCIGPYAGQTILPTGTVVVSVQHNGPWAMDWQ